MAGKLSYDLWYLRNGNVLVDLAICVATALQMLSGLLPVRPQRDSEPVHAEAR
jgi:lipopolysaccharide/colanic/teichoic acid biosynthesis glycosyltransferase